MWQALQKPWFDETAVQKLLMTFFLPSFCPVTGFWYSQVQCLVEWICLAASVWHSRHAPVTSGPLAKSRCSSSNLLWSAVLEPALAVWACAGAGSGVASSASTGAAARQSASQA